MAVISPVIRSFVGVPTSRPIRNKAILTRHVKKRLQCYKNCFLSSVVSSKNVMKINESWKWAPKIMKSRDMGFDRSAHSPFQTYALSSPIGSVLNDSKTTQSESFSGFEISTCSFLYLSFPRSPLTLPIRYVNIGILLTQIGEKSIPFFPLTAYDSFLWLRTLAHMLCQYFLEFRGKSSSSVKKLRR